MASSRRRHGDHTLSELFGILADTYRDLANSPGKVAGDVEVPQALVIGGRIRLVRTSGAGDSTPQTDRGLRQEALAWSGASRIDLVCRHPVPGRPEPHEVPLGPVVIPSKDAGVDLVLVPRPTTSPPTLRAYRIANEAGVWQFAWWRPGSDEHPTRLERRCPDPACGAELSIRWGTIARWLTALAETPAPKVTLDRRALRHMPACRN